MALITGPCVHTLQGGCAAPPTTGGADRRPSALPWPGVCFGGRNVEGAEGAGPKPRPQRPELQWDPAPPWQHPGWPAAR